MDATQDSAALWFAATSGFLLFAGGFWIIVTLGHWALAPVERRAIRIRVPTQFSLCEFSLLAVEMQLAFAVLFWWCGDATLAAWAMGVLGCVLLCAWWHGAQRLTRCGIACPWRRGVFLTLVMPLVSGCIMAALWTNGQAVIDICMGRHWLLLPWLAGNLVIIGAFATCRLLTMWAMRNVTPSIATQAGEDGVQYVS